MHIYTCFYFMVLKSSISNHSVKSDDICPDKSTIPISTAISNNSQRVDLIYYLYSLFISEKETLKKTFKSFDKDKRVFQKQKYIKKIVKSCFGFQVNLLIGNGTFKEQLKENWSPKIDKDSMVYKQINKLIKYHSPDFFKYYNFYEILFRDEVYKVSCLLTSLSLVKSFDDDEIKILHAKIPKKEIDETRKSDNESIEEGLTSTLPGNISEKKSFSYSDQREFDFMPVKAYLCLGKDVATKVIFEMNVDRWVSELLEFCLRLSYKEINEYGITVIKTMSTEMKLCKSQIKAVIEQNPESIFEFHNTNLPTKEKMDIFVMSYIIRYRQYKNTEKIMTSNCIDSTREFLYDKILKTISYNQTKPEPEKK